MQRKIAFLFTLTIVLFINNIVNAQITGIKVNGDTCNSFSLEFSVTGTSSSPFTFWKFGDPASGTNDTTTINGGSAVPNPTHIFSAPGLYNICAYFQEPGQPLDSVCQNFNIGRCCATAITASDSCFNNTTRFNIVSTPPVSAVTWNFDDAASGNNAATGLTARHKFSGIGAFNVVATVETPCGIITPAFPIRIVNCQSSSLCKGTIMSSVSLGCVQNPIEFNVDSYNGFTITGIQWNFGDSASGNFNQSIKPSPSHQFPTSGNFNIQAIVNFSCGIDTIIQTIFIKPCPGICNGLIRSFDSCLERTTSFSISADSAITGVSWNFGDSPSGNFNVSTSLNPVHQFSATGNYTVQAIIDFNCGLYTANANIRIENCTTPVCVASVANAFSPNGDGVNDQIAPLLNCIADVYEWHILDRWGQPVYSTKNSLDKWNGKLNGKPLPAGVYYYLLTYKLNGQPQVKRSGIILLMR